VDDLVERFEQKFPVGIFWFGGLLLLGSFFMLALQLFFFFKEGTWPDWVLIDLVYLISSPRFHRWLADPQDWFGLHKVIFATLFRVPTVVGMIILSAILMKIGKPE